MNMKWIATAALTAALAAPAGFTAIAHAAASPAGFAQDRDRGWDQAPDDYRDAQRQGFHEGIEAARQDWNNRHHNRDVDDQPAYRHPPVDRQFVRDFRDGFRRGYSVAMNHMRNGDRDRHDDDNRRPD
jgi:hypothetical protein